LARHVTVNEFSGATAMVLGGSRGLGEVTAKLLAAGGAHVILTYASGQAEAERIGQEIGAWGGSCEVVRYDVQTPAAQQLAHLARAPTHLYYFATPPIFQQKSGFFVRDRFMRFFDFYVDGFYAICQQLVGMAGGTLSVFYPSSVAVESHPPDMTEYAMAKTAAEVLCADLNAQWPRIRIVVNRIPRVLTDQTASLVQVESANPLDVMLPIIRQVQAAVAPDDRPPTSQG
jgi:NAD(P)-dependent dehydrogenase (short-subunit alcohol dehydrogenase family)